MTYYGAEELARSFRTVRGNTLEAAREIPEEKYGFAPAPGCRTVEKLLTHIALTHRFQFQMHAEEKRTDLDGFDFGALMAGLAAEEAQPRTKSEVIDFLEREGETWANFLDGLTEEVLAEQVSLPEGADPASKSRFEMILSVKEHEMHHRGQLMVVQRMLGLVPHLTRQREERMAQAARGS
jgi:uncharacterized damage-inducible protein DinB